MHRKDKLTLTATALVGVVAGWLIPGCPSDEPPAPIVEEPEPVNQGNKIRTIEERIEAPDGTTTIRIITYMNGAEAEG